MLKLMRITRLSWSTDWLGASASNIYRQQWSCGKVIFSQAFVSHSVHRGWVVSASVHSRIHPTGQIPPPPPPWADTSPGKHTPLGSTPPMKHPPEAHPHGKHVPQSPWKQTPVKQTAPPAQCMLGDTGNKRAVRILLECILVCYNFCYC